MNIGDKMKKINIAILTLLLSLCFTPQQLAGAFIFQAKAGISLGYYYPSDSVFKDVYGSGNLMFAGSASLDLTKKLEIKAEYNLFRDKGEMTITEEELTFSINTVLLGIRYNIFKSKNLNPYLGAGVDFISYKEDYPERFEDVSDSCTGFHVEVGNYFSIGRKFHLDLNLRYIKADAEPFEEELGLGGIRFGIGIEFLF